MAVPPEDANGDKTAFLARCSPRQLQLDGIFFAVVTNQASTSTEAVLQFEPGTHNRWSSGYVRLWLGGKETHSGRLSELHTVAMGQRVGDTAPLYHFCLLYSRAEPLLLSTRTDLERRDVSAGHVNERSVWDGRRDARTPYARVRCVGGRLPLRSLRRGRARSRRRPPSHALVCCCASRQTAHRPRRVTPC